MTPKQREQIIKCLVAGNIQKAKILLNKMEDVEVWFCNDNVYKSESGVELSESDFKEYSGINGHNIRLIVFKSFA